MDGLVCDIVMGKGGKNGGPDGCVDGFVLVCACGLELSSVVR